MRNRKKFHSNTQTKLSQSSQSFYLSSRIRIQSILVCSILVTIVQTLVNYFKCAKAGLGQVFTRAQHFSGLELLFPVPKKATFAVGPKSVQISLWGNHVKFRTCEIGVKCADPFHMFFHRNFTCISQPFQLGCENS